MVQSLRQSKSFRILFNSPELVEEQRSGFHHFLKHGIAEELSKISFIEVKRQNVDIEVFLDASTFQLIAPDENSRNCIIKMKTYACKLYVQIRIVWKKKSGEILMEPEPEWVLLAHLPMMTKRGHFVINGSPRVIVHQVVRAPGVYFQKFRNVKKDERNKARFYGDIIPRKGVWVRLQISKTGQVEIKLKKSTKVQAEMVERCLAVIEKQELSKGRTPQVELPLDPFSFGPLQDQTLAVWALRAKPNRADGRTVELASPGQNEVPVSRRNVVPVTPKGSEATSPKGSRKTEDCSARPSKQPLVDQSSAWVHRVFGLLSGCFANSTAPSAGFANSVYGRLPELRSGWSLRDFRVRVATKEGVQQQPKKDNEDSRPRSQSMVITGLSNPLENQPTVSNGKRSDGRVHGSQNRTFVVRARQINGEKVRSRRNVVPVTPKGSEATSKDLSEKFARAELKSDDRAFTNVYDNLYRVPEMKELEDKMYPKGCYTPIDTEFKRDFSYKHIFATFKAPWRYSLGKVGRYKLNKKFGLDVTENQLTSLDVQAARNWLYRLRDGKEIIDDIDHFQNRRVRQSGELIQNQFENGVTRLRKLVRRKLRTPTFESLPFGLRSNQKLNYVPVGSRQRTAPAGTTFRLVAEQPKAGSQSKARRAGQRDQKMNYVPVAGTSFRPATAVRPVNQPNGLPTYERSIARPLALRSKAKGCYATEELRLARKVLLGEAEHARARISKAPAIGSRFALQTNLPSVDLRKQPDFALRKVAPWNTSGSGFCKADCLTRAERLPIEDRLLGVLSYAEQAVGEPKSIAQVNRPTNSPFSIARRASSRVRACTPELRSGWPQRGLKLVRFAKSEPSQACAPEPADGAVGSGKVLEVAKRVTGTTFRPRSRPSARFAPETAGFVKLTRTVGVIPLSRFANGEPVLGSRQRSCQTLPERTSGKAFGAYEVAERVTGTTFRQEPHAPFVDVSQTLEKVELQLEGAKRVTGTTFRPLTVTDRAGLRSRFGPLRGNRNYVPASKRNFVPASIGATLANLEPTKKSSLFSRANLWKIRESRCFYTLDKPQQRPQWQLRLNSKRTPFHSFIPRLLLTVRRGLLSQTWPRNITDLRYNREDRAGGRLLPTKGRLWTEPSVGFAEVASGPFGATGTTFRRVSGTSFRQATPTVTGRAVNQPSVGSGRQPKKISILCAIERSLNKTAPAAGFAFLKPARSSIVLVGISDRKSVRDLAPSIKDQLLERRLCRPQITDLRSVSPTGEQANRWGDLAPLEPSLTEPIRYRILLRSKQKKKLEGFTSAQKSAHLESGGVTPDITEVASGPFGATGTTFRRVTGTSFRQVLGRNYVPGSRFATSGRVPKSRSLGLSKIEGKPTKFAKSISFNRRNVVPVTRFATSNLGSVNRTFKQASELFSTKPINGALREFFGSNPLSQYMDQTNPLAEITHKRRISSLGIGGVSRESAGMAIRGIHPTHYGRICPIETPEGKNAGLVNSLALYARINKHGFIETPYYKVIKGQVQEELGFSFYSALKETVERLHLAPSDLQQSQANMLGVLDRAVNKPKTRLRLPRQSKRPICSGRFLPTKAAPAAGRFPFGLLMLRQGEQEPGRRPSEHPNDPAAGPVESATAFVQADSGGLVPVRVADTLLDVFKKVSPYEVDCIGISPVQILSVATSLIPFLEHNDANRALMGSNMQRQAVPLMISERPIVGTGLETLIAAESGQLIQSSISGLVSHVSANKIIIERLFNTAAKIDSPQLSHGLRSNDLVPSGFRLLSEAEQSPEVVPVTPKGFKVWRVAPRPNVFSRTLTDRPPAEEETGQFKLLLKRSSSTGGNNMPELRSGWPQRGLKIGFAKIAGTTFRVVCSASLSKKRPQTWFCVSKPKKPKNSVLLSELSRLYKSRPRQSRHKLSVFGLLRNQDCAKHQQNLQFCSNSLARPTGEYEAQLRKRPVRGTFRGGAFALLGPFGANRNVVPARRYAPNFRLISGAEQAKANSPEGVTDRRSVTWAGPVGAKHVNRPTEVAKRVSGTTFRQSPFSIGQTPNSLNRANPESSLRRTPSARACVPQQSKPSTDFAFLKTARSSSRFTETCQHMTLLPFVHSLRSFSRSNQETCLTQKPLVQEGEWIQKGEILTDCAASEKGELAVGKNVLIAYLPWEGYNFEDAIVVSDRLIKEQIYASLHIERYVCEAQDIKEKITNSNEWFTRNLPGVHPKLVSHLDTFGFPKIGTILKEGDILVGKMRYFRNKPTTPYEKLLSDILGDGHFSVSLTSLRVPKGVHEARVISHRVVKTFRSSLETTFTGVSRPAGTPKMVHIFLGEKRSIQVGDKMSGRHGNKGIISTILPKQDMPYLPDGSPIDILLNPLGVPSRMNVGQIFESLLGLASTYLNQNFKITAFDELYGVEASQSLVYLKLYQARLQSGQNWLFQINFPGKTRLIDGRSGECFDQWVTVGRAYMLKLIHMVNEKIHARNTGPYALITQQPLRGRSQKGGQRLGEMEVWALEGYGAAYILQELLTKKSDDFAGRQEIINSLVVRSDKFSSPDNPYRDYSNPDDPYQRFSDPDNPYQVIQETRLVLGHPEIFKTLICELQALCLDVGVYALKKESFQREYLGIVN